MTDMLHKPNGWNSPLNQMTEDEWKEYFRLREELDVEYTEEDIVKALDKVDDLLEQNKVSEADKLALAVPVEPRLAYFWKKCGGLKEVMYLNLSDAKKAFPDEF